MGLPNLFFDMLCRFRRNRGTADTTRMVPSGPPLPTLDLELYNCDTAPLRFLRIHERISSVAELAKHGTKLCDRRTGYRVVMLVSDNEGERFCTGVDIESVSFNDGHLVARTATAMSTQSMTIKEYYMVDPLGRWVVKGNNSVVLCSGESVTFSFRLFSIDKE